MNDNRIKSEHAPQIEATGSKTTRHLVFKGIVASAIAATSLLVGTGKGEATRIDTVPTELPVVAVDTPPTEPVDTSSGVAGDFICPDDGGLYSIDLSDLCPSFNTPTSVVEVPQAPSFDIKLPATGTEMSTDTAILAGISLGMGIAALALSRRSEQA